LTKVKERKEIAVAPEQRMTARAKRNPRVTHDRGWRIACEASARLLDQAGVRRLDAIPALP
jgi:hypothetical protein